MVIYIFINNNNIFISKMVQYCVVPMCSNRAPMPGISFHTFPKDEKIKKIWKMKIRRDDTKCKQISPYMRVCSAHFIESDYKFVPNSRYKFLKDGVVPSVFKFTSPKNVPRRILRREFVDITNQTIQNVQELQEQAGTSEMEAVSTDVISVSECGMKVPDNVQQPEDICEINLLNMIVRSLTRQLKISNQKLAVLQASTKEDAIKTKAHIDELVKEKELHTKIYTHRKDFSMNNVKDNPDLLTYYTGFESIEMYNAFCDLVNPQRKVSYSVKLSEEDQMLLVLSKLRQGFDNVDLAFRFHINTKLVSKIFVMWINEFYFRLGCLNLWPHRDVIFKNSPIVFKEKYPTTVIILDGTEMKIETPSSLVLQSQSFSQYKSSNTVKALLGCEPKGGITFISQIFTGSISDKKITQESGFYEVLKNKLESGEILEGDVIMADKGFNIRNEIERLGLNLNIPVMASCAQFEEDEVYDTRKIASCRVHVERAIRRVKTFKILSGTIPISILPHLNQIWTICCILSGFRCVTKSE